MGNTIPCMLSAQSFVAFHRVLSFVLFLFFYFFLLFILSPPFFLLTQKNKQMFECVVGVGGARGVGCRHVATRRARGHTSTRHHAGSRSVRRPGPRAAHADVGSVCTDFRGDLLRTQRPASGACGAAGGAWRGERVGVAHALVEPGTPARPVSGHSRAVMQISLPLKRRIRPPAINANSRAFGDKKRVLAPKLGRSQPLKPYTFPPVDSPALSAMYTLHHHHIITVVVCAADKRLAH